MGKTTKLLSRNKVFSKLIKGKVLKVNNEDYFMRFSDNTLNEKPFRSFTIECRFYQNNYDGYSYWCYSFDDFWWIHKDSLFEVVSEDMFSEDFGELRGEVKLSK